ncbi:predicted protein [Arabidopsis lyrata subsp. lyrata]|uniref:Predicted protein n=1 Tax=Arabidopsis lyrata subsp. lyrata TaxID=81972 RepID=D7LQS7_ARALL|nr:predicted protein [Arabidopsis lyrata subsp. lyrata]
MAAFKTDSKKKRPRGERIVTRMGVGGLPVATTVDEEGNGAVGSGKGELMYMRARFERVIGSRDLEAFYIMNPDVSSGGPKHSVYFLRV